MPLQVKDTVPDGQDPQRGRIAQKCRIVIADSQTLLREGLCALLEKADGMEVVGTADNGSDALKLVEALRPEIILLDISMDSIDGASAISEIKRRAPGTFAVVLTVQDGEEHIWAALQAGADGYVLKEASRTELLMAIDSVLNGKRFISPTISAQIVARYLQHGRGKVAGPSQFESLTVREKQVLRLVAEGRRNREIAKFLCISVKTVEKHRSNLMHKLKLHNTAALTTLALEKGLLGPARIVADADR